MANTKLIFYGTEKSGTNRVELEAFCNTNGEIFIKIESEDCVPNYICLDIPTAIKFAKNIRTEINTAKEVYGE
jgi:hypothetical protein